MGILVFIIVFILCIIGGFSGMPFLFIFPVLSIIFIIAIIVNAKDIGTTQIKEKTKSDVTEEDIQDLAFFDMINRK